MRWLFLLLLVLLLFPGGCAERPLVSMQSIDVDGKVPYRLQLEFESDVPDPYTVFSGPMETYDRFSVGSELEELLRELLGRQGTDVSAEKAIIRFHFKSLTTSFDQFGSLGQQKPLLVLDWQDAAVLMVDREGGGDGGDLPTETWRGAVLSARMSILVEDVERYSELLKIDHQEIILRDDFYPWMHGYEERFDFHHVFGQLLLLTAREVGDRITVTLGPGR